MKFSSTRPRPPDETTSCAPDHPPPREEAGSAARGGETEGTAAGTGDEDPQPAAGSTDVSHEAVRRGEQPAAAWSSERAFVLSTAAAGVGLGNLWRFPTLAGENGGGAFLMAYAVAVLCFALPFAALEIVAGRQAHGSVVASFRKLGRRFVPVGIGVVLLTLAIDSYYFVITGWTLGFAVEATVSATPDFAEFTSGYESVWWLLATSALVGGILALGLSGIERAAQFLMPVLGLVIVGIAVYGLTDGAAGEALEFLFRPDFTRMSDLDLWRAAFGQAFFSMTIGQGYLITYGSYLPQHVNVPRAIASIAAINSSVAILAGLAIFPFVFAAGLDPGAGSELAFVAMPTAFEEMAGGGLLAPAFFWLLFLAALSSCIGGAKVVTAALREQWSRFDSVRAVIAGIGAITLLGVPSALSYAAPEWQIAGRPVLDALNEAVGSNGTVLAALATSMILGWKFPPSRLSRAFNLRRRTATALGWLLRIAPIGLAAVFGLSLLA
ncbi:sodium-dependent transporter [Histidinibacterium lentulum]|nr:sodium-dependent transporter [Histidinibacterium lentulum]